MKLCFLLCLIASPLIADNATPLDTAAASTALAIRVRNPTKSISPIVKRSYERNSAKGLDIEAVERADGSREERPYIALPILFVQGSDELLDPVSRANVNALARLIVAIIAHDSAARFVIQGHTSREGPADANQILSQKRAAKITALLNEQPALAPHLTPQGFGETYARFPDDAPDSLHHKDRRVLVVRQ